MYKGVGRGTTLVSLVWLEADWYLCEGGLARLTGSEFKKGCVLLCEYYSSTGEYSYCLLEWGKSCGVIRRTDPSIWEFPFLRGTGSCWQGRIQWDKFSLSQRVNDSIHIVKGRIIQGTHRPRDVSTKGRLVQESHILQKWNFYGVNMLISDLKVTPPV